MILAIIQCNGRIAEAWMTEMWVALDVARDLAEDVIGYLLDAGLVRATVESEGGRFVPYLVAGWCW